MNNQNGISKIFIIISIALIIGIAAWLGVFSKKAFEVPASWKTFDGPGFTMRYPETIGTKYITATEWPPKTQLFAGNPVCNASGSETDAAGITEKKEINGRVYCTAKKSEGAAGSTYTQYVYALSKGENKAIVVSFNLRLVQCGNFDDPEKTECEQERKTFDIDELVDQIAQTIITTASSTTAK